LIAGKFVFSPIIN